MTVPKTLTVYDFESLKEAKKGLSETYEDVSWVRSLTYQMTDLIMKESPWFKGFNQEVYRIPDILHIVENKEVRKFKRINPLLFINPLKTWYTDEQAMFMVNNFSDEQLQYLSSSFVKKLPYEALTVLAERVKNEHYKAVPRYVLYVLKKHTDVAVRVKQNNIYNFYTQAKTSMYFKADAPTQAQSLLSTFDLTSPAYEEAGMLRTDLVEYLGINLYFMSVELGRVKKGENSMFAALGEPIQSDGPVRYSVENIKNLLNAAYCPGPNAPHSIETYPKKLYKVQDLATMSGIDGLFFVRKLQKAIRENQVTYYRLGAKTARMDKETFDAYVVNQVKEAGDSKGKVRNKYRVDERRTMTETEYEKEVLGNTNKYISRTQLLTIFTKKKVPENGYVSSTLFPEVIQDVLAGIKNYRRYSQHSVSRSHETYYETEELNEALENYYGYFDASDTKPLNKTRSAEHPLYIENVDKLYTCTQMAEYLADTYGVKKVTIFLYIHREINDGNIPIICFGDEKKNRRYILLIKEDVLNNHLIRRICKLEENE